MKTLKLVSALTAVLLATACAKDQKSNAQGGIEGGGGGTLISKPIGTYVIRDIVKRHKNELHLVLNGFTRLADLNSVKKFFGGPVTLLDVLEQVDIEVLEDKPCFDANGNPKDASIHASRPNMICLSAFTIAKKTIKERAKTEVLALIAHELTHFLGASEEEAVDFQDWIAAMFEQVEKDEADQFSQALLDSSERTARELTSLIAQAETLGDDELYKKSFEVRDAGEKIDILSYSSLNALTDDQHDLFQAYKLLLDTTMDYAATSGSDEFSPQAKKNYEKIFGSSSSVTVNQYLASMNLSANKFGDKMLINKIRSRSELKSEMMRLAAYYSQLSDVARAYRFSIEIPKFNMPWDKSNAFDSMVGTYEVVSKTCTQPAKNPETTFTFEVQNGEMRFLTKWKNMFSNAPNENGTRDVWGTVQAFKSGNKFVRTTESGDLWGDAHQKLTQEFSTSGADYHLKSTMTWKSNRTGKPSYSSQVCEYELRKI